MTRLRAALKGDLARYMAEERQTAERAVTEGLRTTAEEVQAALRNEILAAGLGPRLSKSWRAKFYPRGQSSLSAAGLVFTNAPQIVEGFDTGATIRARKGMWLAIPTAAAPKLGLGRRRITPATWPEARYGPLRFVLRPNGPSLLVADDQRLGKNGRFARSRSKAALQSKRGLATVPMFLLYRRTRLKKRLNVTAQMTAGAGRFAQNVDAAFARLDARSRKGD